MVSSYIIISDMEIMVVQRLVNEILKTGEYHLYGDLQVTLNGKHGLVYTQVLVRGTI